MSNAQGIKNIKNSLSSLETRKNSKRDNYANPQLLKHPIDRRLEALGKSREWLGGMVGRKEATIRAYCTRKQILWPDHFITIKICQVLEIDIDYLILGLERQVGITKGKSRSRAQ